MIRVAQIVGQLTHGGVENVVNNLYLHMNRDDIVFVIYYYDDSPDAPSQLMIENGAEYVKMPRISNLFAFIGSLSKSFNEKRIDIVVSNLNTLSIFPLYAAKKAGIPVRISHSHSSAGKGEPLRTALKYVLRLGSHWFATDFFACSERAGQFQFGKRMMERGKVVLIHNAIDTRRFSFNPVARKAIRTEYNIPSGCVVIGHVGRFVPSKNHAFLLKVFKEYNNRNPDSFLMLLGDGPLKPPVINKIEEYGLSEKVILTGNVDDTERYYSAMDVFLMPSTYEGLSLVAVEAQCSGLPVMLSDAMTRETVLTPYAQMLSISDCDVVKWVDEIEHIDNKQIDRAFGGKCLVKAHYDINLASGIYGTILAELYIKSKYNMINGQNSMK